MSIRWGVSPIAWANDNMPELGGDTPLETILRECQEVGFEGVELGGKFPRKPNALKAALAPHKLHWNRRQSLHQPKPAQNQKRGV